jgi:hypothetical protein
VTDQAVWVRDIPGARLQLASRATGATGPVADASAVAPSLDAAGDRVAFRSHAANLAAGVPTSSFDWQAYVRDLPSQTTEIASRANGPAGAPIDSPGFGAVSLSANGDCVAFDATGLGIGDGFDSLWFRAVHLRVLRHECPVSPPGTATTTSPPAHVPPGPMPPAARPPVLSGLKVVPKRFSVLPHKKTPKPISHPRVARGSSIRFQLTLAARVTFALARARPGRRSGKRCLPARGSIPPRRRCTRLINAGSFARNAKRGTDRIAFSGRVGRRALAPGSYRLTATPVAAARQRGRSRTAPFEIVPAR